MENKEIGKRIQERRKALKISVVDIAACTGLSKATIHRYENGDIQHIKLPVLDTIAAMLDVSTLWLIGKSDKKERMDGKTNDICVALRQAIEYVTNAPRLTCGSRVITDAERRTVATTLQLAIDIIENKGE